MIKINKNIIKIDTPKTSLVLIKHENFIEKVYYGPYIKDQENYDILSRNPIEDYHGSMDDETSHLSIFSSTGDGNNTESLIKIKDLNNRFTFRFIPINYEIVSNHKIEDFPQGRNKEATIKITYKEISTDIFVNQYISTYNNLDVLTFQTEIINNTESKLFVERIMSLQLDFYEQKSTMYTFDGRWLQERYLNKTEVKTGIFGIDSKSGHSSHQHNPFTILELEKEGFLGFNLIYSGNHRTFIEKTMFNSSKYFVGINDFLTVFELNKNESIISPEALVTYSKTLDGITINMHKFIKYALIPTNFINKDRPILINNWEATYFDFNQDKIVNIAKKAKETGIELFVLDDGWFGKRDIDTRSLGDWYDYKEKTGDLKVLSKKIKEMGMKFGLWFEPEMISKDSDLYRNNPEYTMMIDRLNPIEKRSQYMLDLTNEKVIDYLYERISSFIIDLDLDYIKWDCNRYFIDVKSINQNKQSAYYFNYFKSLYKLINKITLNFPNVLFESCSAGGNRFDLGLNYYMAQTWASDNTDALDRVSIQEGTLYGYPQHTLGSHVSATPNHQTLNNTSIENRFNIAAVGAFGYELDLTKLDEKDFNAVENQVSFYKEHRHLLQHGNYFRINSIFNSNESSWIIINDEKTYGIATIVLKEKNTNYKRPRFKFKELDSDTIYTVTMRNQNNLVEEFKPVTASGELLNNFGLDLTDFFKTTNRSINSRSIESRMFIIKKQ